MLTTVNRRIRVNGIWEAFEKKLKGRFYFKNFSDGFYRMVYLLEGSVIWQNGDEQIVIRTGEVAVRRGEEAVFIESVSSKAAKVLVMGVDANGMLCEALVRSPQRLSVKTLDKLNNVITVLKNEGGSPENFLERETGSFLHELANNVEIFFLSMAENKTEVVEEKSRLSNEFKEIVEIMRENVEKPLGVKDIADLCGISESSLKKIFSAYSACSVHKYFLKMKIFKAIELLDNNYNVCEISEMLSFNNQNYFGVVFKKETGYSPLNYRKKFLRGF